MLSSTESVDVFNSVLVPSTIKFPAILVSVAVTVNATLPPAVVIAFVDETVMFVVPEVIDVDDNYGLTLNIKFNPLEIKSVTPHPISNIEMFSKKKTDSLIYVVLFHSKAKRLPNVFKFNFKKSILFPPFVI